jgi:hypothetical protein
MKQDRPSSKALTDITVISMTVRVEKIPVLFSRKHHYRLSDFEYGAWIIFENSDPKYYFNVLDDRYATMRNVFGDDVALFLTNTFSRKGLNLSIQPKVFGFPLNAKAEIVDLNLEELPVHFLARD